MFALLCLTSLEKTALDGRGSRNSLSNAQREQTIEAAPARGCHSRPQKRLCEQLHEEVVKHHHHP